MNKILTLFLILFFASFSAMSQDRMIITYDGSYTSTATSAVLDLYSTNQGFLPPRVSLSSTTDAATITGTEPNGLMVYNTNTGMTGGSEGYYYWDGAAWQRLINGNGNFVSGSGTQNYVTKWNNAAGTTIGNSQLFDDGTNVGIGNAIPAQKLDVSGAVQLGTTASPTTGSIRWNPTFKDFEGYDGSRWMSLTGMHERTMMYTSDDF